MRPATARGLGTVDASLIVVGSIVGAGIFLVSPGVAREVHSPAAFLATWLLGGVIALSGALSNGELGGLFPRSGGEYVYLSEAYGPALGFLSGWTAFWVAFPGSIAALATGFGATLSAILDLTDAAAPRWIATAAVAVLTLVNALGLRSGKWTQNVLSATKLGAFAVLLGLGLLVRREGGSGLEPFFAQEGRPGGIASALVSVMFAYSGWNAATYIAGEMRDPAHELWRALLLGTLICAALYLAVNVVYLRAMPLDELAQATNPARAVAVRLGGAWAARCLAPLVAISILSSLQATVLVGPRIYQAMAGDGLFFAPLARPHAGTGAPVVSLAVQAVVSIALLWADRLGLGASGKSAPFDELLGYAMFAIVAFSMLTVGAVFVLRVRRPEAPRPFRVPGYPLVPALFILASAWMLWSVLAHGSDEALRGGVILLTGVPAYAAFRAYGRRRPRHGALQTRPPPEDKEEIAR